MVSGKPPRHSKSKAEPVTIDLDAKDVKDMSRESQPTSKDDAAAKTSSDIKTGNTQEPAKDAVKPENPKPVWDQTVQTPIEPEPNVGKADETKAETIKPAAVDQPSSSFPPKTEATSGEKKSEFAKPDAAKPDTVKATPFTAQPPKTDTPKTDAAKSQSTTPPLGAKPSTSTASTPKVAETKSASNSGLIAVGIVGGLIALLAAGSMQYAGYLPPFAGNGSSFEELSALKTQIANLQQQASNTPQASGDTSALEQRLAALESSTSSGGDLTGKVTQLESAISSLQAERSAQDEKTAELTRRLNDAEAKINEPRDDIEVARAIASAGLKAAIDRGGPFLTELDTLSRVTPDDPAIQSLRPFANTGVPSRAELVRNFPGVANSMLNSLRQSDPNQGIVDRLAESAMSLVKVRPVGNVEGEGAEAKIARMEDKLRNGDLKGAALEWDGLPEPAKAASADYKKSLDARVEVEDLVNGTLTRAINSTGQQG
ncbi:hypothetical protein G6L28_11915 [Agrobacterium larrymoorei]|uniref:COG4223 family protein n=1 Tax=Agrobacterium larrymoorei TaxID=160699 RepID=UPI00157414AB|nr:COG4223 family protein [Agrobacterium larrymoorei]NTJ43301.1 hypothetical protein [Agrobacterium larrymoorei]